MINGAIGIRCHHKAARKAQPASSANTGKPANMAAIISLGRSVKAIACAPPFADRAHRIGLGPYWALPQKAAIAPAVTAADTMSLVHIT